MPVFGVKEWKNHRVLSLEAISKILRDYQKLSVLEVFSVFFSNVFNIVAS